MFRHSNERPNSLRALVLCACTGTDNSHSMGKEVLEYRSPARGVRCRLLVSLLDVWTAFLDARLGGLLLDVVRVIILVLVTFTIFLLLSPLPNLSPVPRPSGRPDRLRAGHSCPALRNMNLEGIRKKDMAYMATRWYACSELLEDQCF